MDLNGSISAVEAEDTKDFERQTTFEDLGLNEKICKGIKEAGFTYPKDIQVESVPLVCKGHDLLGQARTGSGKTAAFVLPALQKLRFDHTVEVLVLVPTRELAQQVVDEFDRLGRFLNLRVVSVVGGQSSYNQKRAINNGAQVVVATPGRLLDHLQSKVLQNFSPKMVILDEADEMLDMGFIDDLRKIFAYLPEERQSLLFSATMPPQILRLSQSILKDPKQVRLSSGQANHQDIEQLLYVVRNNEREAALVRLLESENPEKALIFTRTRADADHLYQRLSYQGFRARALHGDLNQNLRMQVIKEMKQGSIQIVIATDVASRGLDINDLSHVFNFHAPENRERYVHRIGRTGRAGNKGKAITIATPMEINTQLFYKQYPMNKFTLGSIPRRQEVEEHQTKQLIGEVLSTDISESAERFCKGLDQDGSNTFEALCKFVSYLQKGKQVQGPDFIGLNEQEIKQLGSRPSGGGGRGGYGRRGGGGGYSQRRSGSGSGDRSRSGRGGPRSSGSAGGGGGSGKGGKNFSKRAKRS